MQPTALLRPVAWVAAAVAVAVMVCVGEAAVGASPTRDIRCSDLANRVCSSSCLPQSVSQCVTAVNASCNPDDALPFLQAFIDYRTRSGWPSCGGGWCSPCNGNGQCAAGQCTCLPGFSGEHCDVALCPSGCGRPDQGTCAGPNQCKCTAGWTGPICSEPAASGEVCCPNGCSGNGVCQNSVCQCNSGFYGPDCSHAIPSYVNSATCYSVGDPHFLTFDGLGWYTIWAPGVYTTVLAHDFEVQEWHAPWVAYTTAWINQGVSFLWKSTKVEVYAGNHGSQPIIYMNGKLIASLSTAQTSYGSDGMVAWQNSNSMNLYFSLPGTGSIYMNVGVTWGTQNYINLYVTISRDYYDSVGGLCGNFDGDANNDLWPLGWDQCVVFENLYQDFVPSWRVDCSNMLFSQAPSSACSDLQPLPLPPSRVFCEELTEVAEQVCRMACTSYQQCLIDVHSSCDLRAADAHVAQFVQYRHEHAWDQCGGSLWCEPCSGHGQCNQQTGQCSCESGWDAAVDCSVSDFDVSCPSGCSGHGVCIRGQCMCAAGYGGVDCSQQKISGCPGGCGAHGFCMANGVCWCNAGFTGPNCQMPVSRRPGSGRRKCSSSGDPHIFGFDGGFYSYQTSGSHDLIHSDDGSFVVQAWATPTGPGSPVRTNKAVAILFGRSLLEVHANPDRAQLPIVAFEGRVVACYDGLRLTGQDMVFVVSRRAAGFVIDVDLLVSSDDFDAHLTLYVWSYINFVAGLNDGWSGRLHGLCGCHGDDCRPNAYYLPDDSWTNVLPRFVDSYITDCSRLLFTLNAPDQACGGNCGRMTEAPAPVHPAPCSEIVANAYELCSHACGSFAACMFDVFSTCDLFLAQGHELVNNDLSEVWEFQCGTGPDQCGGNDCGGNGVCIPSTGQCHCNAGWSGADCSQALCTGGCGKWGACDRPNVCCCPPGYFGAQCESSHCTGDCSGHGECLFANGTCGCFADSVNGYWNGASCSACVAGVFGPSCTNHCPVGPENGIICSGNGVCSDGVSGTGQCTCQSGFLGAACEIDLSLLKPVVECVVEHADNSWTAFFTYANANPEAVTLAAGSSSNSLASAQSSYNSLLPSTFSAAFAAQQFPTDAFAVQFSASEQVTWQLGTSSVTASSSSAYCQPAAHVVPSVGCVAPQSPSQWTVSFTVNNPNDYIVKLGSANSVLSSPEAAGGFSVVGAGSLTVIPPGLSTDFLSVLVTNPAVNHLLWTVLTVSSTPATRTTAPLCPDFNCLTGFAGSQCTVPCPGLDTQTGVCSGQGVCSDGYTGSGACSCNAAYAGGDCEFAFALVRPVVSCVVQRPSGSWTAFFEWQNGNTDSGSIPTGLYNSLSAGYDSSVLPTSFSVGSSATFPSSPVSVGFAAGASVSWTLGTTTVSADSSSPYCPAAVPVSISSDCSFPLNDSMFLARFKYLNPNSYIVRVPASTSSFAVSSADGTPSDVAVAVDSVTSSDGAFLLLSPGRSMPAFSVDVPIADGSVVWSLGGLSTTALSAYASPYCSGMNCQSGFAGPQCSVRCPGLGQASGLCDGDGVCRDGLLGDGTCKCTGGYSGTDCNFEYSMVAPHLLCVVERADSSWTAFFSYDNMNRMGGSIPLGAYNVLTGSSDATAILPTIFSVTSEGSDYPQYSVMADFDGASSVSWTLGATTATATATSPYCPPIQPVVPQLGCVFQKNDTYYRVSLGYNNPNDYVVKEDLSSLGFVLSSGGAVAVVSDTVSSPSAAVFAVGTFQQALVVDVPVASGTFSWQIVDQMLASVGRTSTPRCSGMNCDAGFYGADCAGTCPGMGTASGVCTSHGICSDGLAGSGLCQCIVTASIGFSGDDCQFDFSLVTPAVSCVVERADDSWTAFFSYDNANQAGGTITSPQFDVAWLGSTAVIASDVNATDIVVPTEFLAVGSGPAFPNSPLALPFSAAGNASWTLGVTTSTATAASPYCAPLKPVVPVAGCAFQHNTTHYRVQFSYTNPNDYVVMLAPGGLQFVVASGDASAVTVVDNGVQSSPSSTQVFAVGQPIAALTVEVPVSAGAVQWQIGDLVSAAVAPGFTPMCSGQQCDAGFFGSSCSQTCPGMDGSSVCSGHGSCSDGLLGTGLCSCVDGFSATDCSFDFSLVAPTVSCVVQRANGSWTAFFSFTNANPVAGSIAAGVHNMVSGGNSNNPSLAVPSDFVAGTGPVYPQSALSVNFDDSSTVSWTLGDTSVSATTGSAYCPSLVAIVPHATCVFQKNVSYFFAEFGYINNNDYVVRSVPSSLSILVDGGSPSDVTVLFNSVTNVASNSDSFGVGAFPAAVTADVAAAVSSVALQIGAQESSPLSAATAQVCQGYDCDPGFFGVGSRCLGECPGLGTASGVCSSHGTCSQGLAGSGMCTCSPLWTGTVCDFSVSLVQPQVLCVAELDQPANNHQWRVYFSYTNGNGQAGTVPAGAQNALTSAQGNAVAASPATSFVAGAGPSFPSSSFYVDFAAGDQITWAVGPSTAVASVDSPYCLPQQPVTVVGGCAFEKNSSAFRAAFGVSSTNDFIVKVPAADITVSPGAMLVADAAEAAGVVALYPGSTDNVFTVDAPLTTGSSPSSSSVSLVVASQSTATVVLGASASCSFAACDSGFYGASCANACPGFSNGISCSGHGQCSDGIGGSGACTCGSGFAGTDCAASLSSIHALVSCVADRGDGTWIAYFGYQNDNAESFSLAAGSAVNVLTASPASPAITGGTVPTTFSPGLFSSVVAAPLSVVFDPSQSVTWTLGSSNATATLNSPYCQPVVAVVPTLACVQPLVVGTFLAWYGYENDNPWIVKSVAEQLQPPCSSCGAPAFFLVGKQSKVFSVGFSTSSSSSFSIGSQSVTATVQSQPECPSQPCPSDCSGVSQGICYSGVCVCNPGWIADDCSVPETEIIPTVSCVGETGLPVGEDLIAFFGYSNKAGSQIALPIGTDNFFQPSPADRGQPTMFDSGDHISVFSVTMSSADTLSWVLGFGAATVSSSAANAGAAPWCVATSPVVPILNCVVKYSDGSWDLYAGYSNPNLFVVAGDNSSAAFARLLPGEHDYVDLVQNDAAQTTATVSILGQSVTGVLAALPVCPSSTPAAAPQVASATISNDLLTIVVMFNEPTDAPSSTVSSLFTAASAALLGSSTLSWSAGGQMLTVTLSADSAVTAFSQLQFQPVIRDVKGFSPATDAAFTISPPTSPVVPTAVITGPSSVGPCVTAANFSGMQSTGGGVRALSYSWSVSGANADQVSLEVAPLTPTLATISRISATSGFSVTLQLTVTDFLGNIGTVQTTVLFSEISQLSVSVSPQSIVFDPSSISHGGSPLVEFDASVLYDASCTSYDSLISYQWAVISGPAITLTDQQAASQNLVIDMTHLPSGTTWKLQVTASYVENSGQAITGTATATLQTMSVGPFFVQITGPNPIQPLVQSQFDCHPNDPSRVSTFSWNCTDAFTGQDCSSGPKNQEILTVIPPSSSFSLRLTCVVITTSNAKVTASKFVFVQSSHSDMAMVVESTGGASVDGSSMVSLSAVTAAPLQSQVAMRSGAGALSGRDASGAAISFSWLVSLYNSSGVFALDSSSTTGSIFLFNRSAYAGLTGKISIAATVSNGVQSSSSSLRLNSMPAASAGLSNVQISVVQNMQLVSSIDASAGTPLGAVSVLLGCSLLSGSAASPAFRLVILASVGSGAAGNQWVPVYASEWQYARTFTAVVPYGTNTVQLMAFARDGSNPSVSYRSMQALNVLNWPHVPETMSYWAVVLQSALTAGNLPSAISTMSSVALSLSGANAQQRVDADVVTQLVGFYQQARKAGGASLVTMAGPSNLLLSLDSIAHLAQVVSALDQQVASSIADLAASVLADVVNGLIQSPTHVEVSGQAVEVCLHAVTMLWPISSASQRQSVMKSVIALANYLEADLLCGQSLSFSSAFTGMSLSIQTSGPEAIKSVVATSPTVKVALDPSSTISSTAGQCTGMISLVWPENNDVTLPMASQWIIENGVPVISTMKVVLGAAGVPSDGTTSCYGRSDDTSSWALDACTTSTEAGSVSACTCNARDVTVASASAMPSESRSSSPSGSSTVFIVTCAVGSVFAVGLMLGTLLFVRQRRRRAALHQPLDTPEGLSEGPFESEIQESLLDGNLERSDA